jgi:hypothetical protein
VLSSVSVESPTGVRIDLAVPLPEGESCTLSYGLPHAGSIGTVESIHGTTIEQQSATELLLKGRLPARLRPLFDEGAFYVANRLPGDAYAQSPVRHVEEGGEFTRLWFENRERRNNIDFAPGQSLTALRPFAYGNLRDSDAERALYRFADASYGTRAGKSYPLWNWCVSFSQFPITPTAADR